MAKGEMKDCTTTYQNQEPCWHLWPLGPEHPQRTISICSFSRRSLRAAFSSGSRGPYIHPPGFRAPLMGRTFRTFSFTLASPTSYLPPTSSGDPEPRWRACTCHVIPQWLESLATSRNICDGFLANTFDVVLAETPSMFHLSEV